MIDEKKIDLATRECAAKIICDLEHKMEDDCSTTFNLMEVIVNVYKAAIQDFLKELWHPAEEEPKGYEQWILVQYKCGKFSSVFQIKKFKSWKSFVEKSSLKHWCYIDDLLPKQKGGEQ